MTQKQLKLPIGWTVARLADLSVVLMGQSPPSSTYNHEGRGLPFFQGKAEFNDLYPDAKVWCSEPAKVAERDDILLSVRAPVGPTNLAPMTCCIGRGLAAIHPESGLNVRYLLYAFRRFAQELDSKGTGTTFKAVSGRTVRDFLFPIAPSAEQCRIGDVLDEVLSDLDAGVAALTRAREKLILYRAAVLKAAVEGALTAEWREQHPNTEPASELLKRILAERRQRWEKEQLVKFERMDQEPAKNWKAKYKEPLTPNEDLALLPTGWCWASVEQVGYVQLGRQRAPKHHKGEFMRPYLRVANVYEDRIDLQSVLQMNFTPEEFETYKLRTNDILLNEGQSLELVGRAAIYRGELPGACFQNTLVRFQASFGVIPEFALTYFRACLRGHRFRKLARWTTNIAHLGADRFAGMEFPLPPLAEQEAIVEAVDDHMSLIQHLETDIDVRFKSAQALRQAILRHAFTGQLVRQDPNDEPASELLKRILREREACEADTKRANNNGRKRPKKSTP